MSFSWRWTTVSGERKVHILFLGGSSYLFHIFSSCCHFKTGEKSLNYYTGGWILACGIKFSPYFLLSYLILFSFIHYCRSQWSSWLFKPTARGFFQSWFVEYLALYASRRAEMSYLPSVTVFLSKFLWWTFLQALWQKKKSNFLVIFMLFQRRRPVWGE